jgi:hypothetical protein
MMTFAFHTNARRVIEVAAACPYPRPNETGQSNVTVLPTRSEPA